MSDMNEFSDIKLLEFALRMLDLAAKEQLASNRKSKWLTKNNTIEIIRKRVTTAKKWAILNQTTGEYWSNKDGWTDFVCADIFCNEDTKVLNLPMDGQWKELNQ